jgi:predicted methyltransferase
MHATTRTPQRWLLGLVVATVALFATDLARAGDAYDAAVAHPGRSAADLTRDALDHPAEILRLAGIKPGMKVADILAGDGYYSELLSYLVGPTGHVLLLNNEAFDYWSQNHWQERIAAARLPNVEHRTVVVEDMGLGDRTLDAIVLVKIYHDLYWVSTEGRWPRIQPKIVLDQVAKALKPGGVVLLVDHSAKPGTGNNDASKLHRIDEEFAKKDFLSRGFTLVGTSDLLRRPDDPRELISYEGPMVGKTDRFVLVFRKDAKAH